MSVFEVLHMMTDNYCLAMCSRFKNVVTAVSHQRTANVNDITNAIDFAEFADCVENYNIFIIWWTLLKFGSSSNFKSRLAANMDDFHSSQKFARCNDKFSIRVIFAYLFESAKYIVFLTAMSTACKEYTICILKTKILEYLFSLLRRNISISLIKFSVAGQYDEFLRRTKFEYVIGVNI